MSCYWETSCCETTTLWVQQMFSQPLTPPAKTVQATRKYRDESRYYRQARVGVRPVVTRREPETLLSSWFAVEKFQNCAGLLMEDSVTMFHRRHQINTKSHCLKHFITRAVCLKALRLKPGSVRFSFDMKNRIIWLKTSCAFSHFYFAEANGQRTRHLQIKYFPFKHLFSS